ncbi:CDGSH iron-sulfur domain-containing protein [Piscinibacter sakaiensis]|uniref:Putative glutamate synthetase n=1 Tax=Piscinibacter sakaiensis TaxID=1547922 RepID=A0A0K8P760_PISS1|nr:CDGSH iron-sulfur domain-containing protein [Piscinibacter sakaiensis]GAP38354.1 putative glutamate synthetase [Piscinibacter sakaiensis]
MSGAPADAVVRCQLAPFIAEVEQGKTYLWCSCGRSETQPFCDGRHKGTPFLPVKYVATETRTLFFCGCKETRVRPLCDNTHARVAGYEGKR